MISEIVGEMVGGVVGGVVGGIADPCKSESGSEWAKA